MLPAFVYVLLAVVALAYAGEYAFSLFDDPREPPRVHPRIPLIGHLLGFLTKGMGYYDDTSKLTDAEMYTVGIFNLKIYVCNTRRLFPVIQRNAKTLSFRPFSQGAVKKYSACSDRTFDLQGGPMGDEEHASTRAALAPGPGLDDQNLRMGNELLQRMDTFAEGTEVGNGKTILLLEWARDIIVQASAAGVFGVKHPFQDPKVTDAYWVWHTYIPLMFVGLTFLAKKGLAARQTVFSAFHRYVNGGIPEDASQLVKERHRIFGAAGVPPNEAAQLDVGFTIAIFANTSPTQYWVLWELFSRPTLLEELRDEVRTNAVSGSKESGFVLNAAAIKTKCPLLLSVLEETQRTRHIHANIRAVIEETLLDDTYLLKKGQYVQMPGSPIHHSTGIYGPTANDFDPYRFVPREGKREVPGSAFLAWGAPPYLCPARQFATTEIMIITALFALRFDMQPVKGGFELDPVLKTGEAVTVLSPKEDVQVRVTAREEFVGGKWRLEMGESKTRVSLASG